MPRWKKAIGYAGNWWAEGADKPFVLTADDLRAQCAVANAKVQAGIPIPLFLEHQDVDEATLSLNDLKARKVQHTLGFPDRFSIENGELVAEGEAHDNAAADTLARVKFASPQFRKNFRDGTGKTWDGWSITHIAATPLPVQLPQKPFEIAAPVAMSALTANMLRLSADGYQKPEAKPDSSPAPDDGSKLKKVIAMAAKCGLVLPEDTTPANFVDRILTALMTYDAARNPAGQQGEPHMDQQQQLQFSQLKADLEAKDQRIKALEQERFGDRKTVLLSRINALVAPVRRISDKQRDKLISDVNTVQFSQGGNPLARVEAQVEMLEQNEPLAAPFTGNGVGLSQGVLQIHDRPKEGETEQERTARLEKEAKELAASVSRAPRK